MRIKFNVNWTGYLDGIHPEGFAAGQEAEIPERIAAVLLGDGRASLPVEAKAIMGAPENKMEPKAPENKLESPGKMSPTHLSGEGKGKGASTHAGGRKRAS